MPVALCNENGQNTILYVKKWHNRLHQEFERRFKTIILVFSISHHLTSEISCMKCRVDTPFGGVLVVGEYLAVRRVGLLVGSLVS